MVSEISDISFYEFLVSKVMVPNEAPIDTKNINEKVYELLRERIVTSTYPPGYKIKVRILSKELGTSQTPIKDALSRLAGEGLVQIDSRKGTYVKGITEQDIAEIFDTRMIIETGAAEIVAKRITDEQIKKLQRLYEETLAGRANTSYRLFIEKAGEFHLEIIRLTGNGRLLNIYRNLNAHMQILRFRFGQNELKRLSSTDEQHYKILEALRMRDPKKARKAVKEHLVMAKNSFLKTRTINEPTSDLS
ncbi:MAG: hypothetical protein DRH12_16810 [Deltaproteobacteria bacterium]|nr:MAG: hypothetical protein DRH12_16810 [Deltaproteobacteria bacterium]